MPQTSPDSASVQTAPVPAVPEPPSFDLVRIEADGAAQVAGRGASGSSILLQVDGTQVAEAAVAGDGSFVALFTLAPNPLPSLMSLVMVLPDGTTIPARETVALAPIAGPVLAMAGPPQIAAPTVSGSNVVAKPAPDVAPAIALMPAPELAPVIAPELAPVIALMPAPETVPVTAPEPAPVIALMPAAATSPVPPPEPATVALVAPEPPAALLVTDAGVKVLQVPQSDSGGLANVTIDTIAYTAEGAVQFGGRGAAQQVVRLYLDNAEIAEAAVGAQGQWSVTLSDIAPGIYTLRADQLDGEGKVTSRIETPFKRETTDALAKASLPSTPLPAAVAVVEDAAPDVIASVVPLLDVAAPDQAEPRPATPEIAAPESAASESAAPESALPEIAVAEGSATPDAAPVSSPAPEPGPAALATPPLAELAPDASQPALLTTQASPVAGPAAPGAAPQVASPAADPVPVATRPPVTITVQPGLTLWQIAREEFGSGILYVQVYEANKNKIRDPDLIYPGQVFTVPAEP